MSDERISLGEKLARRVRAAPDAPLVTCGDVTLTAVQFHRRTNRIARALTSLGVRQGDLVTIGLPNSIDFIEACWAIWKLGATPQAVSHRLPAVEVEAIIELANPPLVVALPSLVTSRKRVTVEDLLALSDDETDLEDRVAPIIKAQTSGGSTGRPKLILAGENGTFFADPADGGLWRFQAGDTALVPGPLYHTTPFVTAYTAICYGGHLVIMSRFDAEAALAEIQKHRATWVFMVPTMLNRVWRLPDAIRLKYDVSSVRTLWHLAAPCPPWLKEAFIEWLGAEKIMELYAGTEAQAAAVITGDEWLTHRGSVGRVFFGQMKVCGPDGQILAAGEVWEIYMRRDAGLPPTYSYVGAEARILTDGWESLGDFGWMDDEQFVYLADRRTDMILVGGANVYPAEIEAALDEHPLVVSSAVVGLPDEDMGARIHAIVQARDGVTADDLYAHLATRLVTYKRPRSFEFIAEPLRDDAGKVRRTKLRDERIAQLSAKSGQGPSVLGG